MSINKSVAKSASVIGIATLLSRLLGFIRDMVIARLFGIYVYAQAFVVAFKIPNSFRDMFGEGATNAVFVPVFSEYIAKRSKQEFWELVNVILNLMLVILMAATVLGMAFAPLIVRLIAPGFASEPYKLATTIKLTRIIFPYILLISLSAYAMGILNSLKHFALSALAPCLLNISIIIFAMLFGEGIKGLSLGVLVGGILQLAIQIPLLYKKGFRLDLFRRFRHPAARTIGILMLPRLLSSCIYQLNNFVDSIFGSLATIVGEGGVVVLYFAYRLIQFPLGIFSNALSQAILPTMSTQALEGNPEHLRRTLSWGLRASFFVLLPASIAFMVLAQQIISCLFQGGRFDIHSAQLTAQVLFFYSIGLFAYGAKKILQSCFFALKDTVTPAKIAALSLALNIILNAILMFPLKIAGLALATSISGIVTFIILFVLLKKRLEGFPAREIIISFSRILAASLCMGLACYLVGQRGAVLNRNIFLRIANLAFMLLFGTFSYIGLCFIFGVAEIRELWRWVVIRCKPG